MIWDQELLQGTGCCAKVTVTTEVAVRLVQVPAILEGGEMQGLEKFNSFNWSLHHLEGTRVRAEV